MTYLIPLRILRGHLPSRELLNRFPVIDDLFSPFIEAIQKGDIQSYDAALDRLEHRLVELNLLLTVEKARELCIRSLFRKVYVRLLHAFPLPDTERAQLQMVCDRQGQPGASLRLSHRVAPIRNRRASRGSRMSRGEHDLQGIYAWIYLAREADGCIG